ncbi:MAG: transketolase [Coriobacteriia bacterium]|nr:transketolase [Coriobacteriia bacterium]
MTTTVDVPSIEQTARRVRCLIVEMTAAAGSGHPGGSLSAADIAATLYLGVMRHDPACPDWPERDRFILSKGHAAPLIYAVLAEAGYLPVEELSSLRKLGSRLQGHPDSTKLPGIEVSTGSLGQGLSVAAGIALGLRLQGNVASRVYCLLGDGELQEGSIWEAAMFAAHHGLDSVTAVVDANGLQIDGPVDEIVRVQPIAEKFRAFGWEAIPVDGHDIAALLEAFARARKTVGRPTVLVADTVKGAGVSFMEGRCEWHGVAPTAEQAERALAELWGAEPPGEEAGR